MYGNKKNLFKIDDINYSYQPFHKHPKKMMYFIVLKQLILLLLFNIILSGCAGQPTGLTEETAEKRIDETVFPGQSHVITQAPGPLDNLRRAFNDGDVKIAYAIAASLEKINEKDTDGTRALHLAVWHEAEDVVELILRQGADPNATRVDGLTALHLAAFNGNNGLIDLLVEFGAELNPATEIGMTPLHWALRKEKSTAAERLIYHGADPYIRRADGLRPYDFNNPIATNLRKRIFDIESQYGKTAVSPVLRFGDSIAPYVDKYGPTVAQAFYSRGVDSVKTGSPILPPRAEASIYVPRSFDYVEEPYFDITVESAGRGELFEVLALVQVEGLDFEKQSEYMEDWPAKLFFGWIPPGDAETRRIRLPKMGLAAMGQDIDITVTFSEAHGNVAPQQKARIKIEQVDNRRIRQYAEKFTPHNVRELLSTGHLDRGAIDRLIHFEQINFTIDDIKFFTHKRAISQDIVERIIVETHIPYANRDLIEIAEKNYLNRSIVESLFLQGRSFSRKELNRLNELEVFTRPSVGFAYNIRDGGTPTSDGNQDGRLQVREAADFIFRLRNNSPFELKNVNLTVSDSNKGVALFNEQQTIQRLGAGKAVELKAATVQLQSVFSDDSFNLSFTLENEQFGVIERDNIEVVVGREVGNPIIALNKEVVSTRRLQVYSGASSDSPVLTEVDGGALFQVTGELDEYYRVSIFGEDGWVPRDAIEDYIPGNEDYKLVSDIDEGERFLQGVRPEVIIRSPQNNAKIDHNKVVLNVTAIDRQYGIERIAVWVNDQPYQGAGTHGERGLVVLSSGGLRNERVERAFDITLRKGENRVRVIAYNSRNIASMEQRVIIESTGMRNPPRLFVLSAGVDEYQDPNLNLRYAAKDAQTIVEIFETQRGNLYEEVHTKLLLNEQANRERIISELNQFINRARAHDVVVLFLAGHGVMSQGTYYFIGHDADVNNPTVRGLSQDDLQRHLLYNIESNKSVVMLDTCQSGFIPGRRGTGPDMDQVVEELAEAQGSVFISASRGTQAARESPEWGHGVFTLALREALLEGRAGSRQKDGIVDVGTLYDYLTKRVIELTKGEQRPMLSGITEFFPLFALE